jgi:hypothetical protein
MLVSQIQRIGRAVYKGEDPVDILMRLQNPVREDSTTEKRTLLVVEVDFVEKKPQFQYKLYDFRDEDESKYLLGLTSGTSTNYSLTLSPSYKKPTKKQKKKGKYSIKFDKMVRIKDQEIKSKKIIDKLRKNYPKEIQSIEIILNALENESDRINEEIEEFLNSKGIEKFDNPLIFRIKLDGKVKFLGEISAMRKLYGLLNLSDVQAKYENAKCSLCGSENGIREGFNLGLYTIDHEGFRNLFFKKEKGISYQYLMCTDCYLYTLLGFLTLKERLNFYAYSLKEGRSSVSIYHYIIPMAKDIDILRKQVEIISEAKSNYERAEREKTDKKITQLSDQISEIKRKLKKESKGKILKELERKQKQFEQDITTEEEKYEQRIGIFTVKEFLDQIDKNQKYIPILDLYYKITDYKQNPKTKEIVSEIYMSSDHIKKLSKVFKKVTSKTNFKILRLWTLQNLVSSKKFLHYYSSLLSLQSIYRKNFQKDIAPELKSQFIQTITGSNNERVNYQRSLTTYEMYHDLFNEAKLWRDF